jgi:hypothetical protein
MKSPLAESLNLTLTGVTPHERMIAMIILAMELQHLKVQLGYCGGGCHHYRSDPPSGKRQSWVEYLRANYGRDEGVFRNYHMCGVAIAKRMEAAGQAEGLALMARQPSTLTEAERESLRWHIDATIHEGETMSSLRREFRREFRQGPPAAGPCPTVPWDKVFEYASLGFDKFLNGQRPSPEEFQALRMAYDSSNRNTGRTIGKVDKTYTAAVEIGLSPEMANEMAMTVMMDGAVRFMEKTDEPAVEQ